ncbi:MAG TPA: hypothetical protein DCQ31_07555 [Bacteroidales bacterium]|nr:hypothetical protein [Bacteroidales bacterium]
MLVELKFSMAFEQLSNIVLGLPFQEKNKLKELLLKETEKTQNSEIMENDSFRKLLLNGPVMSKTQYQNYKQLRKSFEQWSERLFA